MTPRIESGRGNPGSDGRPDDGAGEILRLRIRLSELGTALRNQQASFNDMLEKLQRREEEAVHLASERAARSAAEASAYRLRFLAEASAVLASSLDVEVTLAAVARLAVPVMADYASVDVLDENDTPRQVAIHHRDATKIELVKRLARRFPARPDAPAGVSKVLRTRATEVGFDVPDALLESVAANAEHLALLRAVGLTSYIIAPLLAQNELLGALTVAYAESGRRYTPADVALIEDLARRASTAIQNARLVRGLEEARLRLQQQAEELEAQTEELHQTAAELEENAERLQTTNKTLADQSEEAERARRAAEEANAAKSEFLSTMSHELRTPLNAIAGYGELLSIGVHGPLNESQQDAIDRIRKSQQRLLGMINSVLNFARLEAGKVEMDIENVPVAEVFENLDMLMQPQMQVKGMEYRFEKCAAGVRVRADREKMEQVLLNLLSNALKFTKAPGLVRMYCDADYRFVRIHVADTGPGIAPHRLHDIFEPFVQIDPSRTAGMEGIGLGLAISRDLARAMGGELEVRSVLGEGTTFTFRLDRVP